MRFELELLKFFNFFPTLLPTVLCSFLTMDHLLFQFMVTIYNPLGHAVTDYVRIPVLASMYRVVDPKGANVTAQLVPVSEETKKIPERKGSIAQNELFFQVELPPLGYSTYFVMETNSEFSLRRIKVLGQQFKQMQ